MMERMTTKMDEMLEAAVSFGLAEARRLLVFSGGVVPFSIIAADCGFEIAEHAGSTPGEVYDSLARLLAHKRPCAYALVYDGTFWDGTRTCSAILVEAARAGDATGVLLARPYTIIDGDVAYEGSWCRLGDARQLMDA